MTPCPQHSVTIHRGRLTRVLPGAGGTWSRVKARRSFALQVRPQRFWHGPAFGSMSGAMHCPSRSNTSARSDGRTGSFVHGTESTTFHPVHKSRLSDSRIHSCLGTVPYRPLRPQRIRCRGGLDRGGYALRGRGAAAGPSPKSAPNRRPVRPSRGRGRQVSFCFRRRREIWKLFA